MVPSKRHIHSGLLRQKLLLLLVITLFSAPGHTYAEATHSGELQVRFDGKVIYCATRLASSNDLLLHSLKDGLPAATIWQVEVDGVRDYWVDDHIAEIGMMRKVVPDLLSRSWLLKDEASGISRRVYTISEAIHFLTVLEQLPVIDRSLLTPRVVYVMRVSAELHIGEMDDTWWGGLLESDEISLEREFSIP